MAKACNNKIGVFAKMIPSAGCQYKAKDFYQNSTAACTSRYSFQLRNAPDDATCKLWIEGKIIKIAPATGSTDY